MRSLEKKLCNIKDESEIGPKKDHRAARRE